MSAWLRFVSAETEPGSLAFIVLATRFDRLTDAPHFVLGQEIVELSEELDDLLVSRDVILNLLKPSQVVLNGNIINRNIDSVDAQK